MSNNIVNTVYAVHQHNTGWAYEVHEGGPRRAFLPIILKTFEEQAGSVITDDSLVTIETSGRRVQVERTQDGIKAYQMPEAYQVPQTPWLEPGPRMTPVVPLRFGMVVFGGAIFATGFLALIVTLAVRPAPPPLTVPSKQAVAFADLPISQWSNLVNAYTDGYIVDSLKWVNGSWVVNKARPGDAATAVPAGLPPQGTTSP